MSYFPGNIVADELNAPHYQHVQPEAEAENTQNYLYHFTILTIIIMIASGDLIVNRIAF